MSVSAAPPRRITAVAEIKEITIKREPTGNWYACLSIETHRDPPPKPEYPDRVVGIDVGILKYVHDTDGRAVESLDLSAERERLRSAGVVDETRSEISS